jgi:hypothetical protein
LSSPPPRPPGDESLFHSSSSEGSTSSSSSPRSGPEPLPESSTQPQHIDSTLVQDPQDLDVRSHSSIAVDEDQVADQLLASSPSEDLPPVLGDSLPSPITSTSAPPSFDIYSLEWNSDFIPLPENLEDWEEHEETEDYCLKHRLTLKQFDYLLEHPLATGFPSPSPTPSPIPPVVPTRSPTPTPSYHSECTSATSSPKYSGALTPQSKSPSPVRSRVGSLGYNYGSHSRPPSRAISIYTLQSRYSAFSACSSNPPPYPGNILTPLHDDTLS